MRYRPKPKFAHVKHPTVEMLQSWVDASPWFWRWALAGLKPASEVQVMAANVRLRLQDAKTAKEREVEEASAGLLALLEERQALADKVQRAELEVGQIMDDLNDADTATTARRVAASKADARHQLEHAAAAKAAALVAAIRKLTAGLKADAARAGSPEAARAMCEQAIKRVHEVVMEQQQAAVAGGDPIKVAMKDAAELHAKEALEAAVAAESGEPLLEALAATPPHTVLDTLVFTTSASTQALRQTTRRLDLAHDAEALRLRYEDGRMFDGGEESARQLDAAGGSSLFSGLGGMASDSASDGSDVDAEVDALLRRSESSAEPPPAPRPSLSGGSLSSGIDVLGDLEDGFERSFVSRLSGGGKRASATRTPDDVSGVRALRRQQVRRRLQRQHDRLSKLQVAGGAADRSAVLMRTQGLVKALRTRHLNRFYRTKRRQVLLAKLKRASSALAPDLDLAAMEDQLDPQRGARVMRWRVEQLKAALAAAQDECYRLEVLLELRSQADKDLKARHARMRHFARLAASKADAMKWFIRTNHRLVDGLASLQRRLKARVEGTVGVHRSIPRLVRGLEGCITQESVATRALDMDKLLSAWTPDQCVATPLPSLQHVLRTLRSPWYASCEAVFRRVLTAQKACAREGSAVEQRREDLLRLSDAPTCSPDAEVSQRAVEGVVRAVGAADVEREHQWKPNLQAFLDKYEAEFATLQRGVTAAMEDWWRQPGFEAAPDWALVDGSARASPPKPLSKWLSQWREVAHLVHR